MNSRKPLSVFAPAKINLYLRVTGRLDNGYHTLDSLVAFADIGDWIRIEASDEFSFSVTGPYASAFTAAERDAGTESKNLAVRAVWALSKALERHPRFRITLEKNLPLSSGLGGGSADAAAALWGAMEWWGLSPYAAPHLNGLMMKLGADIPACLACRPVRMSGAGDILTPVLPLPESPVVLINPGKPCSTAQVFAAFRGPFSQPVGALDDLHDFDELAWFIEEQGNDLLPAAIGIVPEITAAIENLQAQPGCAAAGMSGSGATCFGLFREEDDALQAVESLQTAQPAWWVRGGTLNRPERY